MKRQEGSVRDIEETGRQSKEVCPRCGGTGLVCGHVPVISPGACCVDYGNAICPDCGGNGVVKAEREEI